MRYIYIKDTAGLCASVKSSMRIRRGMFCVVSKET